MKPLSLLLSLILLFPNPALAFRVEAIEEGRNLGTLEAKILSAGLEEISVVVPPAFDAASADEREALIYAWLLNFPQSASVTSPGPETRIGVRVYPATLDEFDAWRATNSGLEPLIGEQQLLALINPRQDRPPYPRRLIYEISLLDDYRIAVPLSAPQTVPRPAPPLGEPIQISCVVLSGVRGEPLKTLPGLRDLIPQLSSGSISPGSRWNLLLTIRGLLDKDQIRLAALRSDTGPNAEELVCPLGLMNWEGLERFARETETPQERLALEQETAAMEKRLRTDATETTRRLQNAQRREAAIEKLAAQMEPAAQKVREQLLRRLGWVEGLIDPPPEQLNRLRAMIGNLRADLLIGSLFRSATSLPPDADDQARLRLGKEAQRLELQIAGLPGRRNALEILLDYLSRIRDTATRRDWSAEWFAGGGWEPAEFAQLCETGSVPDAPAGIAHPKMLLVNYLDEAALVLQQGFAESPPSDPAAVRTFRRLQVAIVQALVVSGLPRFQTVETLCEDPRSHEGDLWTHLASRLRGKSTFERQDLRFVPEEMVAGGLTPGDVDAVFTLITLLTPAHQFSRPSDREEAFRFLSQTLLKHIPHLAIRKGKRVKITAADVEADLRRWLTPGPTQLLGSCETPLHYRVSLLRGDSTVILNLMRVCLQLTAALCREFGLTEAADTRDKLADDYSRRIAEGDPMYPLWDPFLPLPPEEAAPIDDLMNRFRQFPLGVGETEATTAPPDVARRRLHHMLVSPLAQALGWNTAEVGEVLSQILHLWPLVQQRLPGFPDCSSVTIQANPRHPTLRFLPRERSQGASLALNLWGSEKIPVLEMSAPLLFFQAVGGLIASLPAGGGVSAMEAGPSLQELEDLWNRLPPEQNPTLSAPARRRLVAAHRITDGLADHPVLEPLPPPEGLDMADQNVWEMLALSPKTSNVGRDLLDLVRDRIALLLAAALPREQQQVVICSLTETMQMWTSFIEGDLLPNQPTVGQLIRQASATTPVSLPGVPAPTYFDPAPRVIKSLFDRWVSDLSFLSNVVCAQALYRHIGQTGKAEELNPLADRILADLATLARVDPTYNLDPSLAKLAAADWRQITQRVGDYYGKLLGSVAFRQRSAGGLEEPPDSFDVNSIISNAPSIQEGIGLWWRHFGMQVLLPAQARLHIFDPANADLGIVVRSITPDPVVIIARDRAHGDLLREAGVAETEILALDAYGGDLEMAHQAAEEMVRQQYSRLGLSLSGAQIYPESERSALLPWIQGIVERYKVHGVTEGQIQRLVEAVSLALSA